MLALWPYGDLEAAPHRGRIGGVGAPPIRKGPTRSLRWPEPVPWHGPGRSAPAALPVSTTRAAREHHRRQGEDGASGLTVAEPRRGARFLLRATMTLSKRIVAQSTSSPPTLAEVGGSALRGMIARGSTPTYVEHHPNTRRDEVGDDPRSCPRRAGKCRRRDHRGNTQTRTRRQTRRRGCGGRPGPCGLTPTDHRDRQLVGRRAGR